METKITDEKDKHKKHLIELELYDAKLELQKFWDAYQNEKPIPITIQVDLFKS